MWCSLRPERLPANFSEVTNFESVRSQYIQPAVIASRIWITANRMLTRILTMPFHRWSTGSSLLFPGRLHLITTEKHTRSRSISPRTSIEFGTEAYWRKCQPPALASWISFHQWADGVLSQSFCVNAIVPQNSVLVFNLLSLFINDLLFNTSNPIHSFANEAFLHCSLLITLFTMQTTTVTAPLMSSVYPWIPILDTSSWDSYSHVDFNVLESSILSLPQTTFIHFSFPFRFNWPMLHRFHFPPWTIHNFLLMLAFFHISASFTCHAQNRFSLSRQLFHFNSSFSAEQSSNCPSTGILQSCVGWGFVCFSSSTWSGSMQCARMINDHSLTSSLQVLAHRRGLFTVHFLSLPLWLLFSGASFVSSYTCNLRLPIQRCKTPLHPKLSVTASTYNFSLLKNRVNEMVLT